MINLLSYAPIISVLVSVGDSTDYTAPAVAAGVGVGAIAVALIARLRSRDDDAPSNSPAKNPPAKSRHLK